MRRLPALEARARGGAELAADGRAEVTILSVVPEAEARGSKSGGHRWLAPHAHLDVAVAGVSSPTIRAAA